MRVRVRVRVRRSLYFLGGPPPSFLPTFSSCFFFCFGVGGDVSVSLTVQLGIKRSHAAGKGVPSAGHTRERQAVHGWTDHVAQAVDKVGLGRGVQRLDLRARVGRVDAQLFLVRVRVREAGWSDREMCKSIHTHPRNTKEPSVHQTYHRYANVKHMNELLAWSMMTMLCPLHRQSEYLQ